MIEKETKPMLKSLRKEKYDIGGVIVPTGSWAYIFLNTELILINYSCVFSIYAIRVYLRKFEDMCNKK